MHNRNVLTWLKSWDGIVFGKEAPAIASGSAVSSGKYFSFSNQNNNKSYST